MPHTPFINFGDVYPYQLSADETQLTPIKSELDIFSPDIGTAGFSLPLWTLFYVQALWALRAGLPVPPFLQAFNIQGASVFTFASVIGRVELNVFQIDADNIENQNANPIYHAGRFAWVLSHPSQANFKIYDHWQYINFQQSLFTRYENDAVGFAICPTVNTQMQVFVYKGHGEAVDLSYKAVGGGGTERLNLFNGKIPASSLV